MLTNLHPVIVAAHRARLETFRVALDHPLGELWLQLPALVCVQEMEHHASDKSQRYALRGNVIIKLKNRRDSNDDVEYHELRSDVNVLIAEAAAGDDSNKVSPMKLELYLRKHIISIQRNESNSPQTSSFDAFIEQRAVLKSAMKYLFPKVKQLTYVFNKLVLAREGDPCSSLHDTNNKELSHHRGTLLVVLISWHRGGDLLLKSAVNGEDLAVFSSQNAGRQEHTLSWCAYSTEVQPVLEPVLAGTRVVLQYDVIERAEEENGNDRIEGHGDDDDDDDDDGYDDGYRYDDHDGYNDDDDDDGHDDNKILRSKPEDIDEVFSSDIYLSRLEDYLCPLPYVHSLELLSARASAIHQLLAALPKYTTATRAVAFPLFGLYPTETIEPGMLKPLDREFFQAIIDCNQFAVALVQVILTVTHKERRDGHWTKLTVLPYGRLEDYDVYTKETTSPNDVNESQSAMSATCSDEKANLAPGSMPRKYPKRITFIVTPGMPKVYLSGYKEEECRYFSVVMVVWKK